MEYYKLAQHVLLFKCKFVFPYTMRRQIERSYGSVAGIVAWRVRLQAGPGDAATAHMP